DAGSAEAAGGGIGDDDLATSRTAHVHPRSLDGGQQGDHEGERPEEGTGDEPSEAVASLAVRDRRSDDAEDDGDEPKCVHTYLTLLQENGRCSTCGDRGGSSTCATLQIDGSERGGVTIRRSSTRLQNRSSSAKDR